jgi:hypothetical protein
MDDLAKNDTRELTPQEVLFCDAYADAESETYGNATKSAELAKYKQPHNAGWKLRQRQVIKDRLKEIYEKNKAGIGKVMSDLEYERLLAIKKGDISSAIRASELQGKRVGAFSDKHIFLADEQPQQETSPETAEDMKWALELVAAKRYLADAAVKQVEKKIEDSFSQGKGGLTPQPPAA